MIGEYVGTVLFMVFALGGTKCVLFLCFFPPAKHISYPPYSVALIPNTSVTGGTTEGQAGSAASTVNTSNLLYIALSFGFSLAINAWIFFRVSGGLFNPAVSLGMVLVGAITPLRGALLTFAQILGGITVRLTYVFLGLRETDVKQGAAIIQALTPGTLNVRTQLAGGTTIAQGLFIEMFLTILFVLIRVVRPADTDSSLQAHARDSHVGRGEAQGDVHRPDRYRARPLRRRTARRVLHGWLAQPCTFVRP
jgi:aquaporin related protein